MSSHNSDSPKSVTLASAARMAKEGEPIACLTAYDASFAHILDGAGVDIVLVGDSLGMVVQGRKTTVPVTMDDMVYHSSLVARGLRRAMLMIDMPFMSYSTERDTLNNAARLMQQGQAHIIKLEAGGSQSDSVRLLARHGVPVCAHLGLTPQFVHKIGGYRVQGREQQKANAMLDEALRLQDAGVDMVLLECIPSALSKGISDALDIPVIGIGAGPDCDGQILVLYDMLGITPGKRLRFTRDYLLTEGTVQKAVSKYVEEVKARRFPLPEHGFE